MTLSDDPATLKHVWEALPQPKTSYSAWLRRLKRLMVDKNPQSIRNVEVASGRIPRVRGNVSYDERKFVAYDGEGWGTTYALLANSEGKTIFNKKGLSTKQCLDYLAEKSDEPTIRVFFAFGYDVDHIIKDLQPGLMRLLLKGALIKWHDHHIKYAPGKWFELDDVIYYDVWSFFGTSFINAVELILGSEYLTDELIEGKAARGGFETWKRAKLESYNALELKLLVMMMDKFRTILVEQDIHLAKFYGPGAIAEHWMRRRKIKPVKYDEEIEEVLSRAYFGGRFEQLKLGRFQNVYEYDIRSAYPSVMSQMPSFNSWSHATRYIPDPYSVWHVVFDGRKLWEYQQRIARSGNRQSFLGSDCHMPLPMRSGQGILNFPLIARGWYWQSEIAVVLDYFPPECLTIIEGYIADTSDLPFQWVADVYQQRLELKKAGSESQYGLKIGLNSLYGKTAQRTGNAPFHSLAWAGYITSTVRAKINRAGYEGIERNLGKGLFHRNSDPIIGFATDAIFSTEPLPLLKVSENLGDWEFSHFPNGGLFLQSGVYRLYNGDGTYHDRSRGSPKLRTEDGRIITVLDEAIASLDKYPYDDPVMHKQQFVSHKLAMAAPITYGPRRLQFIKVQYSMDLAAPVKRFYHFPKDNAGRPRYDVLLKWPISSYPLLWTNGRDLKQLQEATTGKTPLILIDDGFEGLPKPISKVDIDENMLYYVDDGFEDITDIKALPDGGQWSDLVKMMHQ